MRSTYVYLTGPRSEFVALGRTQQGRLFKKQILKFGSFAHPNIPGEKLVIDRQLAERLVQNFQDGVCDIVQVPIVGDKNDHVEDPLRNVGEVVGLTVEGDGVYATIDARRPEYAEQIGKTLLGASAMMHLDYTDTRTGEKVGPTLLHLAITNRPYITNLADFEEVIAASADTLGEAPVVLSEEEEPMADKDELIRRLREEHGIDVETLIELSQRSAPSTDDLVQAMGSALEAAGVTKFSSENTEDEIVTVEDVAEAVVELAGERLELANEVKALREENEKNKRNAAEAEVDGLIKQGKVLPKARDVMIELSMTDRGKFSVLVADDSLVQMSEDGVTVHENPAESEEKFAQEAERLANLANEMTHPKK